MSEDLCQETVGLDRELLLSCVAGLGCFVENKENYSTAYFKTDDCIECLKDIQRFLREDEPGSRPAFFALQNLNIAKSDLVPLVQRYPEDKDVVFNVVKVATFLSMPVIEDSQAIHKQIECMQRLKAAFLKQGTLGSIVGLVLKPLENISGMTEEDVLAVQLVLAFVRNLLCIPNAAPAAGGRGDHKARMSLEFTNALFDNYVMDLILSISQHVGKAKLRSEAPLLLEVYSRILHGLDAQQLLEARLPEESAAGALPTAPPAARTEKRLARLSGAPAPVRTSRRHPRFGGAPLVIGPDGRTAARLPHNSLAGPGLPALQCHKPKTRLLLAEEEKARAMPGKLLARLRVHLEAFLSSGSYGALMGCLLKKLEAGLGVSRLGPQDFLRFLQLARLCIGYTFLKQEKLAKAQWKARQGSTGLRDTEEGPAGDPASSPFSCISATMGWETLHLVQNLWMAGVDLPPTSKEKHWDLQHAALALMKEMLLVLDLAHQTGSAEDSNAANRLMHRLLHDDQKESGLLPVLSRLLKGFSFRYQPRSHAAQIVETLHVTLRLLERLSRAEAGAFMVKRTVRQRRRRRPPAQEQSQEGREPDAAGSDIAESRGPSPPPDTEDAHGSNRLPRRDPMEDLEETSDQDGDFEKHTEEEEEEEAARRRAATKEVAYNVNQRVRQELACPSAIHIYSWLLRGYSTNSQLLNHAIVAFFRRIASQAALNLEPMLYQVSVLRVFHQILADHSFKARKHSDELLEFCTGVVRNLVARVRLPAGHQAKTGRSEGEGSQADAEELRTRKEAEVQLKLRNTLFVELLFWKTQREAEDLREEYHWKRLYQERGASPQRSGSQSPGGLALPLQPAISSAQEQRLVELFEAHGMEKDYVGAITDGFQEGWPRSRVARQLKALGLKRGVLTAQQKEELTRLYGEHSSARNFLQLIADGMPGSFRKSQIATHLRKLGLGGKRGRGTKAAAGSEDDSSAGESPGEEEANGPAEGQPRKRSAADWSDDDDGDESDMAPAGDGQEDLEMASAGLGRRSQEEGPPVDGREDSPPVEGREESPPIEGQKEISPVKEREESPPVHRREQSVAPPPDRGAAEMRREGSLASPSRVDEVGDRPSSEPPRSGVKKRRRLAKKAHTVEMNLDFLDDA